MVGKSRRLEPRAVIYITSAETEGCMHANAYLAFTIVYRPGVPAYRTTLSQSKSPPTSTHVIKILPDSHAQKPISLEILGPVKVTAPSITLVSIYSFLHYLLLWMSQLVSITLAHPLYPCTTPTKCHALWGLWVCLSSLPRVFLSTACREDFQSLKE